MPPSRRAIKHLHLLHYDRLWIKSGLMDEDWLEQQAQARKASGEEDVYGLEPYHFDSFQRVLDTRDRLTDAELADYAELALRFGWQAQDAIVTMLIGWRGLRPHQLRLVREYLLSHIPRPFTGLSPKVQAALDRRAFLFSLAVEPLTEEVFARYMASGDPDIQESLIKRKNLSAAQIEALAERGASRIVREQATACVQTGGEKT